MAKEALINIDLGNIPLYRKGKVRNVYDLGDKLLFVVSDRISAFDVIMPNGIPGKGKVLNLISDFWFDHTGDIVRNHVISTDIDNIIKMAPELQPYRDIISARSMLVKKLEPLNVECIVRGYISGSGWKDYQKTGSVCGIRLPGGLKQSEKLPEVIFTPSTKADEGHDINISQEEASDIVGDSVFRFIMDKSIAVYEKARDFAASKGIIIADTKFEFGLDGDEVVLMDEVLTPDSSRFWPKDDYSPGRSQKSFDKQFVRDYLETLDWDKTPPGPVLPDEIVDRTAEKYWQAYSILTGREPSV